MKIYGRNVVKEAVNAGRKVHEMFIAEKIAKKDFKYIDFLNDKHIKVTIVPKFKLDQMVSGLHQGYVALVEGYNYVELESVIKEGEKQYFLILDKLEDPHNLGAIIRTAECTQIDGIIIPKNNAVALTSTVVKVACGALEYVNVIQVNNINQTIDYLKKKNFWVVGTDMNAEKEMSQLDPDTSLAVIIGNEGKGISKLTKEKCDYMINIPMFGKVNSLNASVSAALIMYEIIRKR